MVDFGHFSDPQESSGGPKYPNITETFVYTRIYGKQKKITKHNETDKES